MPAIYFVLCDFGAHGKAYIERVPNSADRASTVRDMLGGQFDDPLEILEIDHEEGTCRDVSEDIAREVADIARACGERLTWGTWAFVNDHTSSSFARGLEPESLTPVRNLIAAE